jgi:N-acyl-D-amino-acid deacylase
VVRRYGGVYITHIRSEGDELLEGIEEAIEIGRRTGVPVEIYHLKAAGQENWGKMAAVIARIHEARAQGLDVTADMYPYAASGTGLDSLLPPWVAAEGKFFDNLRDPELLVRIRQEVLNPSGKWEAMGRQTGPDRIMPLEFRQPENRAYAGKRLSEIAAMRGQDWFDTVIDLLRSEGHRIGTVYFSMDEANLVNEIRQPWMKIATDAGGIDPAVAAERGPVHPRAYGTYPRVLRKFVREEGVISLEDAVRKMTSAVADRVGLRDRGTLRAGCYADVVIFDPETVGDRATFEDPHQLSTGIRDVWVNGARVIAAGEHIGATPGRVVYGPGYVTT